MLYQVRPAQLAEWIAQLPEGGVKPVVLDVREPWECEVASVVADSSFELLRIPMNEVPARMQEIDQERPVACLCHHGARSMRVASFLAQEGFDQVANITGGIDLWSLERDASVPRY